MTIPGEKIFIHSFKDNNKFNLFFIYLIINIINNVATSAFQTVFQFLH